MANQPEHSKESPSGDADAQQQKYTPEPEYRSRVGRGPFKLSAAMFKDGATVYVKKGRTIEGPYTVSKRNTDGTYELVDSTGKVRHSVKESDIDE